MDRLSHYTVPAFLRCAIVVICLGTSLAQAETAFIEKAMPAPIVEIAPPPLASVLLGCRAIGSGAAPNGSGSRAIMSRGSSRPCQRQLSKLSHRHRRLPMSGCADIGDGTRTAGTGTEASGSGLDSAPAANRRSRRPAVYRYGLEPNGDLRILRSRLPLTSLAGNQSVSAQTGLGLSSCRWNYPKTLRFLWSRA